MISARNFAAESHRGPHVRGLVLLLALTTFLGGGLSTAWASEGWSHWRGPSQDGTATADGALDHENLGLELVWSKDLGSGYSGISVLFGVALTAFTDGDDDVVVALEAATGKELWRHVLGPRYDGHDGSDDGPLSTPVVADGRVFALAPRGRLVALDLLTGEPVWSTDLAADHGATKPFYGFTTTPLVVGDTVVLEVGGEDGAFLALDATTGQRRWASGSGEVSYQSAILARLNDREVILATGETTLSALDPGTGEELWTYTPEEDWSGALSGVVVLPDDRVLLYNGRQSRVVRVASGADGKSFETLWTENTLRANFSAPVYHDEHLYGYSGRFLTCVRAADGESVWKSRPPGGIGLIRVDDHLVLGSREGGVVIAAASPEGYVEQARYDLGERASYTAPTFAGGLIFHRDLERLAAFRPVAASPEASASAEMEREPRTAFEHFLQSLEGARNPSARINAFLAERSQWPLVEGEIVHFLYRGPASDVGLGGSWLPSRQEVTMERIAGTDVYHHTTELPSDSRVEYWLTLDFEDSQPDPANPRRVPNLRSWWSWDRSELRMPEFEPPAFEPGIASAAGIFETFEHDSAIRGNQRTIEVYRPAGVSETEPLDLLVMVQGEEWLTRGDLPAFLDRLVSSATTAPLVAFVGGPEEMPWQETGGAATLEYAEMLAKELIPALEERYALKDGAASRTIAGSLDGAAAAVLTGLAQPEAFGRVIALSPEWRNEPRGLAEPLLAEHEAGTTRFVLDTWAFDAEHDVGDGSLAEAVDALRERLEEHGHTVGGGVHPGASGWGVWPGHLAGHLASPGE